MVEPMILTKLWNLNLSETSRRILQMEEKVKQQSNDLHEIEKKLKLAETELNFAEETRKEVNQKVMFT